MEQCYNADDKVTYLQNNNNDSVVTRHRQTRLSVGYDVSSSTRPLHQVVTLLHSFCLSFPVKKTVIYQIKKTKKTSVRSVRYRMSTLWGLWTLFIYFWSAVNVGYLIAYNTTL